MGHGWYWQTVRQAKGRNANWMYQLDKHHNQVRIRITLKSNDNYNERHILDNLEIKGWGCAKGVGTDVKTFTVKDKSGNAQCKSVSRKIIVKDPHPPVIQLKILKGKQLSASGQDGLDSTKNAAHKMF